jgi:membrane-associated phospholipid phosphatase
MATGNHFWLDVLAGVIVAAIALFVIYGPKPRLRRRRAAPATA